MFRRIKVPQKDEREFNKDLFEEEKYWLERRRDGELITSSTPAAIKPRVLTSLIIALIIGGSIGALIGGFTANPAYFVWGPTIIFIITFSLLKKRYALIEIDTVTRTMMYEGVITYGGEPQSTRYMGPIEVINFTQVVQHKLYKTKFIRFGTNSGYLRAKYDMKGEKPFLETLESFGLINLHEVEDNLRNNTVIKSFDKFNIVYEIKFDRTEFVEQLKLKREEAQRMYGEEKKERRERLLNKSKQRMEEEEKSN